MKKSFISYWSIVGILCLSSCTKTPVRIIEDYSGLKISHKSKVLNYVNLDNSRGEKVIFIKILIEDNNLKLLDYLSKNKEYLRLPIDVEIISPEQNGIEILNYLSERLKQDFYFPDNNKKQFEGYYKFKKYDDSRSFDILIADMTNQTLILYSLTM